MRRWLPLCLAILLAGGLVAAAPAALAHPFTPQSGGSPNADRINWLYRVGLYIAIVVFVGVEGALLYSLIRFRARRGRTPVMVRGNTRLEVGWTVGAAVILVALAALTFAELSSIRNPDNTGPGGYALASTGGGAQFASLEQRVPPNGRRLNIQVNGQQYIWRFTYPGAGPTGFGAPYSYEEMVVPTDTTITLDVVSQDVVHSWWVPELGGKVDAVPGLTNHTWFKIHRPGLYRGQCAELCGRHHAAMIATVRAVPPDQFAAWLAQRKADIAAAQQAAAAERAKLNSQTGAASVENP
ncbi:MAG TPA: cytochrome c oxidase subunit II [Solirubrobacteraceae bacterium]|nr:cytochrome c oxidase subunit II [Solirubrobacteraceae bacterium]